MSKKVFNPVKVEKDSKAQRVIWSTESIDMAVKAIEEGRRLKANPFYENNIKLLKPDLVRHLSDEEIVEWKKCAQDATTYFVGKYAKTMTPEGVNHITLRDYQEEYLDILDTNRLTILLSCRQSSKTTSSAMWILKFICFNYDKNVMIIGNRNKTATEVLGKLKDMFMELPHFLKPGVRVWNVTEVAFDNGCRIITDTTTPKPALGFTIHACLWDEAAHVNPNVAEEFYSNLFPTLQAANGKMMITSTQNGYNLFYRLYMAAKDGVSSFKNFEIDWDRVPEWDPDKKVWYKRDEAWRQKQIANLGSEESFNAQFGISFHISSKTLIDRKVLKNIQDHVVEFTNKDMPGVSHMSSWYWHPDVDPLDLNQHAICITCDLAEGVGGDYTVYQVWSITDVITCLGYFRDNTLGRSEYTKSLIDFTKLLNPNRFCISIERNTYGDVFVKEIESICNSNGIEWDGNWIVKYYNESGTRWAYGIKITSSNKPQYCLLFKESFERKKIVNNSTTFVTELLNFVDKGNGTFNASYGHDDMIMSAVQLEFVKDTTQFKIIQDSDTGVEQYDVYSF